MNISSKTSIIILIISIFSIAFFKYKNDQLNSNPLVEITLPKNKDINLSKTPFSTISSKSTLKNKTKKTKLANKNNEQSCKNGLNNILKTTSANVVENILNKKYSLNNSCLQYEDKIIQTWAKLVYASCKADKIKKSAIECKSALLWYRAYYLYKEKKDIRPDMLYTEELINGFYYETINRDVKKLKNIVVELKRRLPNSPFVAKAYLIPILFETTGEDNLPSIFQPESRDDIARARKLNPKDLELLELDILTAIEAKEDNIEAELLNLSEDYMTKGIASYYLAWLQWMAKNKQMTLEYLSHAISAEPKNNRYQSTLNLAKESNYDIKIFSIRINLDPETV